MIYHNTTVYKDGSITSFESEVIEHGERVFHIKSGINYRDEQEAIKASQAFWQSYPKTDEELRTYLDAYKMEVQILGLLQ